MDADGFQVVAQYPEGVVDIAGSFPELMGARALTLKWLMPRLCDHFGVGEIAITAALDLLSDNYVSMLDSREGIQVLAAMVGQFVGQADLQPLWISEQ